MVGNQVSHRHTYQSQYLPHCHLLKTYYTYIHCNCKIKPVSNFTSSSRRIPQFDYFHTVIVIGTSEMAVGQALFGNSNSRNASKNLVEFRAGRMSQSGKMVNPDKRKGLVYVYQSDDALMHFCWKDRQTGAVEDDLIIFPDDCEYKRVTQCTTGRVYVLKFKTSSRRFFFWMQEPKTDKDDDHCRRINEVLNNPPTPGSGRSGGTTPGSDSDLQNLFSNMSQQQLMQLFGSHIGNAGGLLSSLGMNRSNSGQSRPSSTVTSANASAATAAVVSPTTAPPGTAATTTPTPSSAAANNAIQLRDLQNILSGLNVPTDAEGQQRGNSVDLSLGLSSDVVNPVLTDPSVASQMEPHLPSIPEGAVSKDQSPSERFSSTVHSAQFQQAMSMFSAALNSGQIGALVQQFQLSPEAVAAANNGDMEAFVKAIEKYYADGGSDDKKDEEDDGMSLD